MFSWGCCRFMVQWHGSLGFVWICGVRAGLWKQEVDMPDAEIFYNSHAFFRDLALSGCTVEVVSDVLAPLYVFYEL